VSTYALLDCRFEFNSVDLSDWVTGVTLPWDLEALDDTAMGDTARSRKGGLGDSNLQVQFNQDFAPSAPDATIWAVINTIVVVKVRPTSASISATNPEYVGSYLINQWIPFSSNIGELAKASVSWPLSDPDGIARNTS
jgi:hypothetical protein